VETHHHLRNREQRYAAISPVDEEWIFACGSGKDWAPAIHIDFYQSHDDRAGCFGEHLGRHRLYETYDGTLVDAV
jgi:hypothetical protein